MTSKIDINSNVETAFRAIATNGRKVHITANRTRRRGIDLSVHSQAKLSEIAGQLNERPRKVLQYQTPAGKFAECVSAISRIHRPLLTFGFQDPTAAMCHQGMYPGKVDGRS